MSLAPFPSTRRSVVADLASDDPAARERAFGTVVECYWRPLFKYARIAWKKTREEAQDLTQGFFLNALERESLAGYDGSRSAFRTFVRLLFDRHVSNEWKSQRRLKRGGGQIHLDFESADEEIRREPSSELTPEEYFHREWVRSLFTVAVERLRADCERENREVAFRIFEAYDLDDDRAVSYRELAGRFAIPETQVTNHLSAIRRRFRQTVLDALRELTVDDREFQREARALLGEST